MKRKLFTLASALSLVLCTAMVVLWVRSHVVEDEWYGERRALTGWNFYSLRTTVIAGEAGLYVRAYTYRQDISKMADGDPAKAREIADPHGLRFHHTAARYPPDWQWRRRQFTYRWNTRGLREMQNFHDAAVGVPDWALVLLLSVLPAAWLLAWFRKRTSPGLCRRCGYDLRATPDRCPECGTVPARREAFLSPWHANTPGVNSGVNL